jgi:hypothetical protein
MTDTNIALGIALLAALGSLGAAIAAWLSLRATRLSAEGMLGAKWLEEYDKPAMRDALRGLVACQHDWGDNFAERWIASIKTGDARAEKIDCARRLVKGYFLSPVQLYSNGLVSRQLVHTIADQSGLYILYEIVEPLERALSATYGKHYFDTLRTIVPNPSRIEDSHNFPAKF